MFAAPVPGFAKSWSPPMVPVRLMAIKNNISATIRTITAMPKIF